ncbi:MAG: hypothetical protein AAFY16_12610, partial [Cyanobacteria bacterium J06642_3]
MPRKKLEVNLKGEGYDEVVELNLGGKGICNQYTYIFVTTHRGEGFEINLDISQTGRNISHILKRSGNY